MPFFLGPNVLIRCWRCGLDILNLFSNGLILTSFYQYKIRLFPGNWYWFCRGLRNSWIELLELAILLPKDESLHYCLRGGEGRGYATALEASHIDGVLPKGPYPPCLRKADRALVAGYPRYPVLERLFHICWYACICEKPFKSDWTAFLWIVSSL